MTDKEKTKGKTKEKVKKEVPVLKLFYKELPVQVLECGIDECGRGTLMGNVVAAAVVMPLSYEPGDLQYLQIKDSKKLSKKKRALLSQYIHKVALGIGIGSCSPAEIDSMNIRNATFLAMHRALDQLNANIKGVGHLSHLIVDGNAFKPYYIKTNQTNQTNTNYESEGIEYLPFVTIIKGDDSYISIAAASIVAKVYRDEQVAELAETYPEYDKNYGWSHNMGYGTADHMAGIREHGITDYHRKTFAPCKIGKISKTDTIENNKAEDLETDSDSDFES